MCILYGKCIQCLSYTKFHKNKLPEGSIYSGEFLRKTQKRKNEVTGTEKRRFWLTYISLTFNKFTFLGPISILTFFNFSQNEPEYIDTSGHFTFNEIFCSSNFYSTSFFSSIVVKLNISVISIAIIIIF